MFESLFSTIAQVHDVEALIAWGGLALVCAIVFVETGLLFGFFLPGDSLLVTAGVFAAAGYLPIVPLLTLTMLCAIAGDQVGYLVGKHLGARLYKKHDSKFFKRSHLEKANAFYKDHGVKTIVLARFVPIVRTFVPTVAGTAGMDYRTFTFWNIMGGVLWVGSMIGGGYLLGALIPNVEEYLHYIVLGIIVVSLLPVLHAYLRRRK